MGIWNSKSSSKNSIEVFNFRRIWNTELTPCYIFEVHITNLSVICMNYHRMTFHRYLFWPSSFLSFFIIRFSFQILLLFANGDVLIIIGSRWVKTKPGYINFPINEIIEQTERWTSVWLWHVLTWICVFEEQWWMF